ncbi:MAG TPA: formyltransferase family protein [Candidatus Eisenbacteria bacterium]|nr:formyltransferase family protein [Candidatus Eisenbacteria bacterium]
MTGSRPRVTVVTNGNYFASLGLGPLLGAAPGRLDVQVLVTTGLRRQHGNRLVEVWQLARRWGWRYFGYKAATHVIPKAGRALRLGGPGEVTTLCERAGIPVQTARNVNDPGPTAAVRRFDPDLLVSFSCPYRIGSRLLAVPRIGCLNVHSSLLPSYAGICTYVHVLADGCGETGVTVHEMVDELDAGRIVAQRRIAIPGRTSTFALFSQQCRLAGELLLEAVQSALADGRLVGEPQDLSRRSYRGEPTAADVDGLRRRGHRLMTSADVLAFLRGPAAMSSGRA